MSKRYVLTGAFSPGEEPTLLGVACAQFVMGPVTLAEARENLLDGIYGVGVELDSRTARLWLLTWKSFPELAKYAAKKGYIRLSSGDDISIAAHAASN